MQRLEREGRNPFADYFVAEAAVSLKQGAGRLIRSESDRGLLVVCDPRMAGMNYGRRLRQALPPMTPLDQPRPSAAVAGDAGRAATRRLSYQIFHHDRCCGPDSFASGLLPGKFFCSTRSASSRSCFRPSRS